MVNRTPTARELTEWWLGPGDAGKDIFEDGDSFIVLDSTSGSTARISLWAYPFPSNQPPVKLQAYDVRITKVRD